VVSGIAARLIGQRPDLSPDQLKHLLRAGAVDLADPVSADGAGRVDAARSARLATPSHSDARQDWERAVLDLRAFARNDDDARERRHGDHDEDDEDDEDEERESDDGEDEVEAGSAEWSGRRWSGRRWSGMKWSGMKWSGMKWSGAEWVAAEAG
jgi:serine protease AprX